VALPPGDSDGLFNPILSPIQTGVVPLMPVAPALYSQNGSGEGAAAGSFSGPGGTVPFQCPDGTFSCIPLPLELTKSGMLTLAGTGIIGALGQAAHQRRMVCHGAGFPAPPIPHVPQLAAQGSKPLRRGPGYRLHARRFHPGGDPGMVDCRLSG
jgi:hypothetical protein